MKENDYYNIYRKCQVHSASIFGLGAKTKIGKWQPPSSTPNYDSLPYSYPKVAWSIFFANMTAKDDLTISCSHLVAERSVLYAWKKILKGGGNQPPSVDEG